MTEEKAHSELFRSLSQELLAAGRSVRFKAIGTSMGSTIRDGEVVHVEPVDPTRLRKGDIVLFADESVIRVHRIFEIDRGSGALTTRGDAMEGADAPIAAERILGRVVAKERVVDGAMRTVPLCGIRSEPMYWAMQFRGMVSRVIRHSSFLTGAKTVMQKAFLRTAGLFLVLSLLFGGKAFGQIAIGDTSSGSLQVTAGSNKVTVAHTVAGTNRLLVVGVSINLQSSPNTTVSGVTYNGVNLTRAVVDTDGTSRRAEIWYLVAPPTGTNLNVVATLTGVTATQGVVVGAITFTGTDQSAMPFRDMGAAHGTASPTGVTVDSAVGDMVVDTLAMGRNRTPTAGNGQTQRWNAQTGNNNNSSAVDIRGFGSTEAGAAGTVSMTETLNGATNWSQVAVSVMPYPLQAGDVIGLTPALYFNQTTATGTNQLLVVGVSMNIAGNTGATVTGITYNGVALTRAGAHNDTGNTRRAEIWYLVNPTVGTSLPGVVSLNLPGGTGTIGVRVGSTVLTGIDPNSPVRSVVSADGAAQSLSSLNVPSAFGDTVVDTLAASGNVTGTIGPTQVQQWAGVSAGTSVNPDVYGLGSTRTGAPSVPMTEVFSAASNWSQVGVSFRPYSADLSVTNVATSTAFPTAVSYQITVKNNGPSTANAVTLTDAVASGLTGVTASASAGSCNQSARPITCNLGNIASGASAVVTVTGTPGTTGGYPNTATVPTNLTPTDYNGNNNSGMAVAFSQTPTCSSTVPPAASQPLTSTINTYFPPSVINTVVAAGSTSVTLGASRGANSGISAGDELIFIQMQDAAINTANTSIYGDGVSGSGSTNLNNAGVYEYVRATNNVPATGGSLTFAGSGPGGGLLYAYTNAAATSTQGQRRFQVVRVPQYSSATLSTGLTAVAWDGSTGGIFALDIAGTLTLGGGTVNVDGLGFRGGAGMQLNGSTTGANTDYRAPSPTTYTGTAAVAGANAPKAEGIAGTPIWVESNNTFLNTGSGYPSGTAGTDGSMGRGAPGNAGGGGTDANPVGNGNANDENSGGGGGGNGGVGGAGGNAWSANLSVGGYGGAPFPGSTVRVVMGGGGGAGTRNNSTGNNLAGSGGAGGGIVIIRAGSLVGTATITANGAQGYDLATEDAGGGGGAGGSVIVLSQSGGEGGLTIRANGGKGGNAYTDAAGTLDLRHGPGGGGGGGVVLLSGPVASVSAVGGVNGTTTKGQYPYGATSGNDGVLSTTESLSATPGNQSPTCFPDMEIVKTHTGDFPRGGSGVYTLTVSNVSGGPVPYANSVGQVTVTDTVPAGLTLTGASGTGWTCNVVPPTLTCARSETLSPGASYSPLLVSVAVPTSGPASVTNSATVSGGGELNTANDVSSDPTNIVAASTMLIAMTAPAEVTTGSSFNYVITVTNSSGATQNGVTVTDTLPSGVTYSSWSSSQGTCSQSNGTVSCSLGTMAANGTATITISVQAGPPAQVENTAVVNPSGNTATAPTIITYGPTAVNLESFTATASSEGVLLKWKTGQEFNNLGFNLYREQNGDRTRITPSMIAGSALTLRGARPQHAGKTYAWIDRGTAATGATYWLEDVDLNGTRTMNGPARVEESQSTQRAISAQVMAQSRARSITVAEWNDPASSAATVSWHDTSASHMLQASPIFPGKLTDRRNVQFALAGQAAVKIFVDHEGWYKVTQPELVAAGLSPFADARSLQLYVEGVQQPIRVTGASGATFGPQAAIEFYGTGIDTPFSDKRVYWLVAGQTGGKRIIQELGFGWNTAESPSFPFTVELKERAVYFAALLSDRPDNFFGAVVSSTPVDQILKVSHLADGSGQDARLQVALQGVTTGTDHAVQVSVNGNAVGSMSFTGQAEGTSTFSVPRGILREGANTVTLTAQNGESDVSVVDYIRLTYSHSYTADSNLLKFTAGAGQSVVVQGFTQRGVRVFDITDASAPVQLALRLTSDDGGFSATVRVPVYPFGIRTLLAVADDQIQRPAQLAANAPSNWHSAMSGAEYVVITSGQFAQQVKPLADLRRAQGRSVAVVNVEDLYDEFNFGERSPNSIRDFLSTASTTWRTKPASMLLVGDASFDSRNYLGFGDFDFVPTEMINTAELKTASDDWFSDFTGTGVAQIATGRLPVRTQEDAQAVVSKIVGYETSTQTDGWQKQVMLVANGSDEAADFIAQAATIQTLLPGSLAVTQVLTDRVSSSTARQQIVDAIDEGKLLVNYNGHGSVEVWSDSSLFDNAAAGSLRNGSKLPVFLMMNCLNGYFHDVYTQSLAETLLLSKDGGAVAVWASSGLTSAAPQFEMDKAVVSTLFSQPSATLGEAIRKAKASISDSDARKTFLLFGDPLLRLKFGGVGR